MKRRFPKNSWYGILETYGNRCAYCKRRDVPMTKDHVIPTSLGGTDTPDNWVPACSVCNGRKRDMSPTEFARMAP